MIISDYGKIIFIIQRIMKIKNSTLFKPIIMTTRKKHSSLREK